MDFSQLANQALTTTATPATSASPIDAIGDKLMAGIEIGGTGLALAYLNSRSPGEDKSYHESFGKPTDVLVAIGGVLMGLLFNSPHALRIGLGAFVEVGARYGLQAGAIDRRKALAGKEPLKAIEGGKKTNVSIVERASSEAFERAK